jgi:predicted molibdopterin-dependent oxidoreductase YjgC
VLTALALAMDADKNGWRFRVSEDVFEELADTNAAFAGMSYELLNERKGIVFGEADKEFADVFEYESHTLKPS